MKSIRLLVLVSLLPAALVRAEPVKSAPAPVWQLKDVAGQVVRSDQFKGKVVVIDFWATWCPPCRAEIPGYVALQQKYRDQGLVVIGISLDQQGPDVVKKFMAEKKVNYTMVMGTEEVQAAFGGIEAIPTTFIIDRAGNLRDRKVGGEDEETYEQTLLQYLKP